MHSWQSWAEYSSWRAQAWKPLVLWRTRNHPQGLRWVLLALTQKPGRTMPCRADAVPHDRGRTRRQKVSKFLQTSSFARRRTKMKTRTRCDFSFFSKNRLHYFYCIESNVLHYLLLWEMFSSKNGSGTLSLAEKCSLQRASVEVKDFFLSLPMALERDDVVVVHAAWDEESDAQRYRAVRFRWVHFRMAEAKRMVHSMRSSEKLRQSEGNAIHSVYQALWRQKPVGLEERQYSDERWKIKCSFNMLQIVKDCKFLDSQTAWLSGSIHLSF